MACHFLFSLILGIVHMKKKQYLCTRFQRYKIRKKTHIQHKNEKNHNTPIYPTWITDNFSPYGE